MLLMIAPLRLDVFTRVQHRFKVDSDLRPKGRNDCALFTIAPFIAPLVKLLFLLSYFNKRAQYTNKIKKLVTVGKVYF